MSVREKLLGTLTSAAQAAKTDLVAAKKRQEANQKKEEEKQKKAEKAAGVAAAKGKPSLLFDADGSLDLWQESYRIQRFSIQSDESCVINPDKPCIVSGTTAPVSAIAKAKEFAQLFSSSALRVTEGRANLPCDQDEGKSLANFVANEGYIKGTWHVQLPERGAEEPPVAPEMDSIMKVSMFDIAACSVSCGRLEPGALPTLRMISAGTLSIEVLTPQDLTAKNLPIARIL